MFYFLDVLSKYLGDFKSEINKLKQKQKSILSRLPSTASTKAALPDDISLPLKKFEDLNKLEICLKIEENKTLLENYLCYVGGEKTPIIVRRVLGKVFTNALATQCNWTGKNSKRKLKDLRLIEIILGVVRKHRVAEKATDTEIINVLTNWFRFAKDRDGGRKLRRNANRYLTTGAHNNDKIATI